MPKYQLTADQKQRLCSIVEGLKERYISTEWSIAWSGQGIEGIHGLKDKDNSGTLWREVWAGVTFADFHDFAECGLFRITGYDKYGQATGYSLNLQRIINACESDFGLPIMGQPTTQTTYHIDNSGIVNIQSTLNDASQIVNNAPTLDSTSKQQLAGLFERLNEELANIAATNPEEAEAITTQTSVLAQEISRERPNRLTIKTLLSGLDTLAEKLPTIAKIVDAVADIANNVGG